MKIKRTLALSFFALFGFIGQAFADAVTMHCDNYGINTMDCSLPLWVSNGLGANTYMDLVSISGNNLDLSSLPTTLGPPPPGQANTDTNGLAQIIVNVITPSSPTTVVYNVNYVDPNTGNQTLESICTFTLMVNSEDQLTGTGSCAGDGLAAPVNAVQTAALDIGIN